MVNSTLPANRSIALKGGPSLLACPEVSPGGGLGLVVCSSQKYHYGYTKNDPSESFQRASFNF